MSRVLARAFALWLPFLVTITGFFLFTSWAVQQNYRQSLNDPQIGVVEDAAGRLATGEAPADVVGAGQQVDISTSLALWMAVYDASGNPIASSGLLEGAMPNMPPGIFDMKGWRGFVIGHHLNESPANENRFSWQPRANVRQAVILVHYDSAAGGGYVAAGRNMREVEWRIAALSHVAAFFWGATALATLIALVFILTLGWL
jgi:hypothetical protein